MSLKGKIDPLLFLGTFIASKAGDEYGITPLVRLRLAARIIRNQKHFASLTTTYQHLTIIDELFKVPKSLDGDVIECGCYDGCSTTSLSLACSLVGRRLFVCDSFEGLPQPDAEETCEIHAFSKDYYIWEKGEFKVEGGLESVRRAVERYGAIDVCTFVKGYFIDTLEALETDSAVLIFEDADLLSSVEDCVKHLWPKLQEGCLFFSHEPWSIGIVGLFHDTQWWKENLNTSPPGFFGSGFGIRKAAINVGVGYSKKFDLKKIKEEGRKKVHIGSKGFE